MVREHAQVGPQHGDLEAGGADIDAEQHAEAAVQLQGLGAAAAGGALQAGLVQQALLEQAGDSALAWLLEKPSCSASASREPPADQKVVSSSAISSAVRPLQGATRLSPLFVLASGQRAVRSEGEY